MSPEPTNVRTLRRWIGILSGIALALLITSALLFFRAWPPGNDATAWERLRNDPDIRRAAVEELVRDSTGIFDSHPDPEVARILQPGLEGVAYKGALVHTNRLGLREVDFEIPKPAGVLRIIVLGDSFVFGNGVEADERMGAQLATLLRERAGALDMRIECLHVGIESWNAVAEAAYVRRQLDELQPDLIAHLIISNDLDDNMSVRGFGALAEMDVRNPDHVGVRVAVSYPTRLVGQGWNHLNDGLDWESRHRLEELAEAVAELRGACAQISVPYLCFVNCAAHNPVMRPYLEGVLPEGTVTYLPSDYVTDQEYWVSPTDQHWNAKGHERFARLLYGLVEQRGLLPALDLAAWPAATKLARGTLTRGSRQAERSFVPDSTVLSALRFDTIGLKELQHVHTGIDLEGRVSPYASLILSVPEGARALEVEGRFLQGSQRSGARVEVLLDERACGELSIRSGAAFRERFELPSEVRGRSHLSVRFAADDWVITGKDRRTCRSFVLSRVAIE